MSCTIIRPKDRAEWLKHRESGIGSSEVGTILGLNPFESPYQLWLRKRGQIPPKEENFAMKAGHYLEDAVSLFFHDATGYEIIKSSSTDWMAVDNEHPYMRVSPDRTYWLSSHRSPSNKGILECKTTQLDISEDDVPSHWYCQLQYQLGVAGLNEGSLAWLTAGRKFGYRTFPFDKEFFAWIEEEVTKFWNDNIQGGIEPSAIRVEDILLKNPREREGKTVIASPEIIEQCNELQSVKSSIASLESRKKELEGEIKFAMSDAESLVRPDSMKTLCTWRTTKDKQKFNEKKFASEHADLYSSYMVSVPGTRTFLLKKQ